MKKSIFLLICCLFSAMISAQESGLTKKDLKGIKVENNSFSETTFYTSKKTGLYVASGKAGVSLQWTLTCCSLEAISIKSISVKIDGKYYDIPVDEDRLKDYFERPVSVVYFYSQTTNYVDDYLFDVINKIIDSKSEVLIRYNVFSSIGKDKIDGAISSKNIEEMRRMVNIYLKLKNGK